MLLFFKKIDGFKNHTYAIFDISMVYDAYLFLGDQKRHDGSSSINYDLGNNFEVKVGKSY